jgi:hypothetical protein
MEAQSQTGYSMAEDKKTLALLWRGTAKGFRANEVRTQSTIDNQKSE